MEERRTGNEQLGEQKLAGHSSETPGSVGGGGRQSNICQWERFMYCTCLRYRAIRSSAVVEPVVLLENSFPRWQYCNTITKQVHFSRQLVGAVDGQCHALAIACLPGESDYDDHHYQSNGYNCCDKAVNTARRKLNNACGMPRGPILEFKV
jgi:hypothetical protein